MKKIKEDIIMEENKSMADFAEELEASYGRMYVWDRLEAMMDEQESVTVEITDRSGCLFRRCSWIHPGIQTFFRLCGRSCLKEICTPDGGSKNR